MRKTREVLRLHFDHGLKFREIGRSCRMSAGKVSEIIRAATDAQVSWPLPEDLGDSQLASLLYPKQTRSTFKPMPDFSHLSTELKKKGVTRHLLWEEYRRDYPDGYGYTQFCEHFKNFVGKLDLALRREHKVGEKLFVDWAGQTIGFWENGELKQAQLFVAVLGASNYTFAGVYRDQRMPNWIGAHADALAFLGGVPEILVPDNTKTGVTKPCYYDPELNPTYRDLATHYHTVVIPARAYHPQDKADVEAGVRFSETQILAALRNVSFQSLGELKEAVGKKLKELQTSVV